MMSPARLALSEPLEGASVPVTEVVARTRRAEARCVMATVAGLRDNGVSVRDIAVVVRDLDPYEEPLYRGAIQYGLTPVFWTQLRVTQTRPYALVESVCNVLGAETPDREALYRPLEHRWCPPSGTTSSWPIDPKTVQTAIQAVSNRSQTIAEWRDEFDAHPDLDERFVAYVEWLNNRPEPTPRTVRNVLGDVVEAYEEFGLPATKAGDSPALIETERDARAVVRVTMLLEQLQRKYADRIKDGTIDRSWSDVTELCQLIATQRPGRREQSNVRAVDVLEANDVWLLDIPYVVAAGLVDRVWPQQTERIVPPELQEAILAGDDQAAVLAPRTAWTDGRDRDQFDDTVRAARNGLIVTRHTHGADGEQRRPSPLLDSFDVESVPEDQRRGLLGPDRVLPSAIRAMLDGWEGAKNE